MEVIKELLNGALLIAPTLFKDDRGYFSETFNYMKLKPLIGDFNFVQDNQSLSQRDVLRGMHFQRKPFDQGKLVRVIQGSVIDVIVDMRVDSPSYGKHASVELTSENFHMLWIPPGFAHGFLTLEDNTVFFYKVTNYYNKESEACIKWNDHELDIKWSCESPIVSEKDNEGLRFSDLKGLF